MLSKYVKSVICGIDDADRIDDDKSKRKSVKVKKMQYCDGSVWVGLYHHKVYAISSEYNLVYNYMTQHRKLGDGEYEICNLDSNDIEVRANPECILTEYYGLYVAERDITMSHIFARGINVEISNLQTSLLCMARVIGQSGKKHQSKVQQLMKTYAMLDKIVDDKDMLDELEEINELDNQYIYSDMITYNRLLLQYESYTSAFSRYMAQ